MRYKLFVSDIDGVWTDGSFFYSQKGDCLRKFTTKDSFGVRLCQLMEIPLLILSTEENQMVQKRMEKLNIKHVKLGVKNKIKTLSRFCEQKNISLEDVAYVGDDMNDFQLLKRVGFFACPSDAYYKIKEGANKVLETKGGEGAFRNFVEYLLNKEGDLEKAYQIYTDSCLKK